MPALSIRNMRFTLARREQEGLMTLPTDDNAEKSHYWHVERKAKRGKKWIFVREGFGTEKAAQEFFEREYANRTDYEYRLRRVSTY